MVLWSINMEELGKKYYKIKDVADFIGVPESTLRYWESEFTDLNPIRSAKGIRLYTSSDIETVRIIYFLLKVRGLKIDAAKMQMQVNRKNISKRLKVIDELLDVRSELDAMLKTLSKRRT